jgi:peptidyl-prolyl cis-trans isomerase SurA
MRTIRSLLLTLLVTVCTPSPAFLLAGTTNRIVAHVNSEIVTLYELNAAIEKFVGVSANEFQGKDEERFYQIRRAVLDNLINEKIAHQQIDKLGIKVTAEDVDEALEKVKRDSKLTQEELVHSLKLEGITLEEYRERLKREIERARLVNAEVKSKIVITEKEAREYYQQHANEYEEAPMVRLARILLQVEDPGDQEEIAQVESLGRELIAALAGGRDFFELAKNYSKGPASEEGGDLGWIRLGQIEPTLREKIARLSAGQYTDFHRAGSGFQIIKLVDEKKGGVKPFAAVSDSIYSKLFKEKIEKKYALWIKELRDKSFIKVVF